MGGLTVVNDCPHTLDKHIQHGCTTFPKVKESPKLQIANYLLPSEWQKLTSFSIPFAEHIKILQSDIMSKSLVVPALFDLLSHLGDFKF